MSFDVNTAQKFLQAWFSGAKGYIEIRPLPNHKIQWRDERCRNALIRARKSFAVDDITSLLKHVKKWYTHPALIGQVGWYYGVCPRIRPYKRVNDKWVGGSAEDVETYMGIWADIDDHRDNPQLTAQAIEKVNQLKTTPTFVIRSGGGQGRHIYYKSPAPMPAELGKKATFELAILIGGDPSIADPARVMRLPGTEHTKSGIAIPVTISKGELVLKPDIETKQWLEKFDDELKHLAAEQGIDLDSISAPNKAESSGDWAAVPSEFVKQMLPELCPRFRTYVDDPAHVSQPEWFYMAGTLKSLLDDSGLFHLWSEGYPGYSEHETQQLWDRVADAPARCMTYQMQAPTEECKNCPYFLKNQSPNLILRYEYAKKLGISGAFGAPKDGSATRRQDAAQFADQPSETATNNEVVSDEEPFDFGISEVKVTETSSGLTLVVDNVQALTDLLDPIVARLTEENVQAVDVFQNAKKSLATLRQMSPTRANAYLQLFKKAGLGIADMRAELNAIDREAAQAELATQPSNENVNLKTVDDMLNESPLPGLLVPDGYILTAHAILKEEVTKDGEEIKVKIASAPIIIQGVYVDIDQDIEYIQLSWINRKKWKSIIVERDYIANTQKMLNLAANGFPADALNAKGLLKYLRTFESLNQHIIPATDVTTHAGWQSEKEPDYAFLLGKKLIKSNPKYSIQYRGASLADERLIEGYKTEGNIDTWLQALAPAMQHPKVALAFYSSFVSSLLEIFGCPNFIVEYAGRTSVGKTTALRVAASVWGNPDERMPDTTLHTWDATRVWIERSCSILSGLPMILDDTKRAKNPDMVSEIAYTLTSGHGRGRGKPQGIAREDSWRNVTISSGETPITSFTEDGGIKGRVLEIMGMPFGRDNEESRNVVNNLNQTIVHNYGHGAEIFINWLIKYRAEYGDIWRNLYQDYAKVYESKTTDGVAARLATYAGAIWAAADLVAMAFEEAGHPLPWVVSDPVAPLWDDITLQAQDPVGEVEALRDVESWCSANEQSFLGREIDKKQPNGGWLGRWDRGEWEFIAIRREPLFQFLEKAGYNPEEIMTAWKGRKWIDTFEHQKGFQKRIWIKGENKSDWFVVLKREIFNTVN